MAGKFENVLMADEIGARIGSGILERVSHACLRRQMQDHIESSPFAGAGNCVRRRRYRL